MTARVFALIATYGRPALLRRALEALRGQGPALAGVVVVNNGGDAETAAVVDEFAASGAMAMQLITPVENLGTPGGVAAGLRVMLADAAATHAWVLDDDAVPEPDTLKALLAALHSASAEAATAMITDARGVVKWFPGPLRQPAWDVIRSAVTPEEFRRRCGAAPLRWNWATWASLLVSRRAVEAVGLPDARLWYQGTDIEYTLRLSARFTGVLAPAAVCPHLPPPEEPARRRAKDLWSLQNGAYVAVRLRHGRRILRHLPGNHFRYWRRQGYAWRALGESGAAFWRGAVLGRPVGAERDVRAQSYELTRP
jgi:GT2 family glycosyltransferase